MQYQVKFEGRVIKTRTSDRVYTHAVVILGEKPGVLAFCGSLELAQKNQNGKRAVAFGEKIEIVPVEII